MDGLYDFPGQKCFEADSHEGLGEMKLGFSQARIELSSPKSPFRR
jgi:hypothetical protein